jgi:hypothetical protein
LKLKYLPNPILTCLAPFLLELRSVLAAELLALMLLRLLDGLEDLEDPAFELAPPLCIGMLAFFNLLISFSIK